MNAAPATWSARWLASAQALPPAWREPVLSFASSSVGEALLAQIDADAAAGAEIYPAVDHVLRALHDTPWEKLCAVIVGQDPYHQPGQADGLAFSVPQGTALPPSLRNIVQEVLRGAREAGWPGAEDIATQPLRPNLSAWSRQGVLLLNTSLTVRRDQAASHSSWGWQALTSALLAQVAQVARRSQPTVYLLWGAHAQKLWPALELDLAYSRQPYRVLKSNHPSPLSANKPPVPFTGNQHFVQAAHWLREQGVALDWLGIFRDKNTSAQHQAKISL
ncbi:uracil-DNA glycosylase [Amphibiibacter pelophylacis]|uniref:Uracil-DNA glycosylase n=1 Tax=Amphibiibacter pelophylacis TaxID=1799477 RepID=A0ACC6P4R5_9BURK